MKIVEISDRDDAAACCGRLFRWTGHEVIKVSAPDRDLDFYLNEGKRVVVPDSLGSGHSFRSRQPRRR